MAESEGMCLSDYVAILCRRRWYLILLSILVFSLIVGTAIPVFAGSLTVHGTPIQIRELGALVVVESAHEGDRTTAKTLQRYLKQLYGVEAPITPKAPDDSGIGHIVIGRASALALGLVTVAELETVKDDGFILRGQGRQVVLAGYAPQGTLYAGYAFLRRIGLKVYPWHAVGGLEVFEPLDGALVDAFDVADKPFFDHRDIFSQYEDGRFGTTIRKYALGDLLFAKDHPYFEGRGWLGWDHTAAFLVPPAKYEADHPEFFEKKELWELLETTPNLRVNLCMCESEVGTIAAERALEWIAQQPERKYFAITDGDSENNCPNCEASDPIPDYYTDRLLRWVNQVARKVGEHYPDKRLFTLAYGGTVKPPIQTDLEPNVTVVYAPWYWSSRNTSAVGLSSPLNPIAWEELTAWTERFPGHVGVYDYPGDWVYGTAARIKEYADLGIHWVYFNGPRGELLHWVASQLLWDRSLDTDELVREFTDAFYGPAAAPIRQYLAFKRATIVDAEKQGSLSFLSKALVDQSLPMLQQAADIADSSGERMGARIWYGLADSYAWMLSKSTQSEIGIDNRRELFVRWIHALDRMLANFRYFSTDGQFDRIIKQSAAQLAKVLGREVDTEEVDALASAQRRALLDSAQAEFEQDLASQGWGDGFVMKPARAIAIRFNQADELQKWRINSSDPSISLSPSLDEVVPCDGSKLRGVRVDAPFTRLPVVQRGGQRLHAGRFFSERTFSPAIDAKGLPFVDIHLFAEQAGPATIYINRRHQLRSDVQLAKGEQVVRIDLRNYKGTRFDLESWDGRIEDLAIDLWPADMLYPYQSSLDNTVYMLGMRFSNDNTMTGAVEPRAVKTVVRARATLPLLADVLNGLVSQCPYTALSCESAKAIRYEYGLRYVNEKFRTFSKNLVIGAGEEQCTSTIPAPTRLRPIFTN